MWKRLVKKLPHPKFVRSQCDLAKNQRTGKWKELASNENTLQLLEKYEYLLTSDWINKEIQVIYILIS